MTAASELSGASLRPEAGSDDRRAWVRPAVEKIEAGSAEVSFELQADVGTTKS